MEATVKLSDTAFESFEIHGIEGEFQPVDPVEVQNEHDRIKKKTRLAQKRAWWRSNAKKLNRERAKRRNSTVRGKYLMAKGLAEQRGQSWDFTYEEWMSLWQGAGKVSLAGTETASNPRGTEVTAFAKRGPNKDFNTFMQRKDMSKGWSLENCEVVYRGKVLADGAEIEQHSVEGTT